MEDFTVWTVEGEGFKVCKEGFNHPVLCEHLVELPLDLAESIRLGTSRGLGQRENLPVGFFFFWGCAGLSHAAFY